MNLPCIYCRAEDVPRTREHVLQDSFGGTLILRDEVCAACNSEFSSLDKQLVVYARFLEDRDAFRYVGIGFQLDPEIGMKVPIRYGRKGAEDGLSICPPTILRLKDGSFRYRGPAEALDPMMAELRMPNAGVRLLSEEIANDDVPVATSIVRSRPNTFFVVGSDAKMVGILGDEIRKNGLDGFKGEQTESTRPSQIPAIQMKGEIPIGGISRALTKVALNFLCHVFGPEKALEGHFDPARRYARFGEGTFRGRLRFPDDHLEGGLSQADPEQFHAILLKQEIDDKVFVVDAEIVIRGIRLGVIRLASGTKEIIPRSYLSARFNPATGIVQERDEP